MKSKIDITEFRNRLKENTKIGSPKLKVEWGILSFFFSDNSKYFYGRFDNSTFEIIKNSNFIPSYYFLKGTYKKSEKNLIVNYSIVPVSKLIIPVLKYFPIIIFIITNSFFYFEEQPPIEIYIAFNLFIVFSSFFSRLNINWENKKLERKFKKVFEIIE